MQVSMNKATNFIHQKLDAHTPKSTNQQVSQRDASSSNASGNDTSTSGRLYANSDLDDTSGTN